MKNTLRRINISGVVDEESGEMFIRLIPIAMHTFGDMLSTLKSNLSKISYNKKAEGILYNYKDNIDTFGEDLTKNLKVLYEDRKDKAVITFEEFTDKVFKRFIADAEDSDLFYDIMDEVEE